MPSKASHLDHCLVCIVCLFYTDLFCISYLNIFEEEDLETERQFFKEHPELGQFDNTVIIGTVFPPPQEDTGLIKVRVV